VLALELKGKAKKGGPRSVDRALEDTENLMQLRGRWGLIVSVVNRRNSNKTLQGSKLSLELGDTSYHSKTFSSDCIRLVGGVRQSTHGDKIWCGEQA